MKKTIVCSVSFEKPNWEFINGKKNISSIVNEALREYIVRRTNPELKIKLLKDKKRELAKQMALLDEEIRMIESNEVMQIIGEDDKD